MLLVTRPLRCGFVCARVLLRAWVRVGAGGCGCVCVSSCVSCVRRGYVPRHCESMIDIPDHIAVEIVFRILSKGTCSRRGRGLLCVFGLLLRCRRSVARSRRSRALARSEGSDLLHSADAPLISVLAHRPADAADSSQDAHLQLRGNHRVCGDVLREPGFCPDCSRSAHCQRHPRRLSPLRVLWGGCCGARGLGRRVFSRRAGKRGRTQESCGDSRAGGGVWAHQETKRVRAVLFV
jgi:hypothetical protein